MQPLWCYEFHNSFCGDRGKAQRIILNSVRPIPRKNPGHLSSRILPDLRRTVSSFVWPPISAGGRSGLTSRSEPDGVYTYIKKGVDACIGFVFVFILCRKNDDLVWASHRVPSPCTVVRALYAAHSTHAHTHTHTHRRFASRQGRQKETERQRERERDVERERRRAKKTHIECERGENKQKQKRARQEIRERERERHTHTHTDTN